MEQTMADRGQLKKIVRYVLAGDSTGDRTQDQLLAELLQEAKGSRQPRYLEDPLEGFPTGTCRETNDGTGHYHVRGRFLTTRVDPKVWRCTCAIGLPRGAQPVTDCEHIKSLRAHLRSGERQCPVCHGSGERTLSRAELEKALVGGVAISYQPRLCEECKGKGAVSIERRRQLGQKGGA